MAFGFTKNDFVSGAAFISRLSIDPSERWETYLRSLVGRVATRLSVSLEDLLVVCASLDDCPEADALWELLDEGGADNVEGVGAEDHPDGALELRYYQYTPAVGGGSAITFAISADQNADTHVMLPNEDFDAFNRFVQTLDLQ